MQININTFISLKEMDFFFKKILIIKVDLRIKRKHEETKEEIGAS